MQWAVDNYILPEVAEEIRRTAFSVLVASGEAFKDKARSGCPVSGINEPGYIHLIDTIDYYVSQFTSFYLVALTMYVTKFYAEYVNNGTSRMGPRPFFTNGTLAVQEQWEEIVERVFASLRAGRYQPK